MLLTNWLSTFVKCVFSFSVQLTRLQTQTTIGRSKGCASPSIFLKLRCSGCSVTSATNNSTTSDDGPGIASKLKTPSITSKAFNALRISWPTWSKTVWRKLDSSSWQHQGKAQHRAVQLSRVKATAVKPIKSRCSSCPNTSKEKTSSSSNFCYPKHQTAFWQVYFLSITCSQCIQTTLRNPRVQCVSVYATFSSKLDNLRVMAKSLHFRPMPTLSLSILNSLLRVNTLLKATETKSKRTFSLKEQERTACLRIRNEVVAAAAETWKITKSNQTHESGSGSSTNLVIMTWALVKKQ